MVRGRIGPIDSIREAVRAERLLWFFCRWCGHASRRDPREISRLAGREIRFAELRRRLKCNRCHRKGVAAIVMAEHRFTERH